MHTATAHLKSIAPYSQSKNYARNVPKLEKELSDDMVCARNGGLSR